MIFVLGHFILIHPVHHIHEYAAVVTVVLAVC